MKLVLAVCLLTTNMMADQSVTLAWNPSASTNVTTYWVYCGPSTGLYTNRSNAGNAVQYTVTGLKIGWTNYFVVTAAVGTNESLPSNELIYPVPIPPAILAVTNQWQAGVNLAAWSNVTQTVTFYTNPPTPFFAQGVAYVRQLSTRRYAITNWTRTSGDLLHWTNGVKSVGYWTNSVTNLAFWQGLEFIRQVQ